MCWSTAQPERRIRLRSRSSRAMRRGRSRNPLRCSAIAGTPTKPSTPIVAPEAQHQLLGQRQVEVPVAPVQHPEDREGDDEHERVRDRCDRRDREAALRVEHRGRHGPPAVEHDLGDEEPEEERGEALLLRRDLRGRRAGGEDARDLRGERQRDHGDDAEPDERDPEDPGGQALGLLLVAGLEVVHERRDEHGRERAGGEELEQHVRDRGRGLEGVAEVGRARGPRRSSRRGRTRRCATAESRRPCGSPRVSPHRLMSSPRLGSLPNPAYESRVPVRLPRDIVRPGSLAQQVEHRAFNPLVQGSSPWRPTRRGSR